MMRPIEHLGPLAATTAVVALLIVGLPEALLAYGGPGSVISGIGALLAAVAAVGAAVFGFVWFPLKRLIRKLRGPDGERDGTEAGDAPAGE